MASKRVELTPEVLELINGGALGFDPDKNGTFTMSCQFTGNVYHGVTLNQIIQIGQYAANVEHTAAGEQQIIDWALDQGIIHN